METNYREQLNMPNLKTFLGVNSLNNDLNVRQRRAINNIKWCANDQWAWVNSWLDERSESARQYMMNARELFDMIYHESLVNPVNYDDTIIVEKYTYSENTGLTYVNCPVIAPDTEED